MKAYRIVGWSRDRSNWKYTGGWVSSGRGSWVSTEFGPNPG